jgi:uncharacterized RDD family membrane protein YckC
MQKSLTESANEAGVPAARARTNISTKRPIDSESNSTLIEFPGSRNIPEWRKRLSQRVREVQEQKAREAAEAEAVMREAEAVTCALPSGQLELVPDPEQAPLNPIVSKALQRVDRARRTEHVPSGFSAAAAAPALAPADPEPEVAEPKPKLTIVAPKVSQPSLIPATETAESATVLDAVAETEEAADKPKRVGVITTSFEDAALAYVDSCLSVPVLTDESRKDIAGLTRRTFVGIMDLILITAMAAPAALVVNATSGDWTDTRVIGFLAGVVAAVMFTYFTVAIALTGRTLGMRLLSVRTIDERTGLIPTGGQSVKRALSYIVSLALFGLGLAFAFIDRERRPLHDRLSKTIVIRA